MEAHIFFDAEGTLYVPKSGYTYSDFWMGEQSIERAIEIFQLDIGIKEMLKNLKEDHKHLHVVSKHKEDLLPGLLDSFGILDLFETIIINGNKGERIKEFIDKNDIAKDDCAMFGDTFDIDIKPVEKQGIRSYLVDRDYNRELKNVMRVNLTDFLAKA